MLQIAERFPIPTGYLFTGEYDKGQLETLSIGDYGKKHNVKADFLGYKNEINGVPNIHCMPLSEKWVITLSTQYGCPMKCTFCDVPNVKFRGNASFEDLKAAGFDVLVFVPSLDEEDGLVTCGNAVLGGSTLKNTEDIIKIEGM